MKLEISRKIAAACRPVFPGEKSSGLIEARPAGVGVRARRRSFRGRNPPASLKRVAVSGLQRLALSGFPGEKSSGLIEARFSSAPIDRDALCFRGRNPPASLKRRLPPARTTPAARCFRGRNPPASLKLEVGVEDQVVRLERLFPGEKSSGLIEASRRGASPIPGSGTFPGEKSSGLIEAPVAP